MSMITIQYTEERRKKMTNNIAYCSSLNCFGKYYKNMNLTIRELRQEAIFKSYLNDYKIEKQCSINDRVFIPLDLHINQLLAIIPLTDLYSVTYHKITKTVLSSIHGQGLAVRSNSNNEIGLIFTNPNDYTLKYSELFEIMKYNDDPFPRQYELKPNEAYFISFSNLLKGDFNLRLINAKSCMYLKSDKTLLASNEISSPVPSVSDVNLVPTLDSPTSSEFESPTKDLQSSVLIIPSSLEGADSESLDPTASSLPGLIDTTSVVKTSSSFSTNARDLLITSGDVDDGMDHSLNMNANQDVISTISGKRKRNYLPRGYWNKERIREIALQFSTRSAFYMGSKVAYNTAHRQKWLDEICAHMGEGRKPNGYWSKDRCQEEAMKYSTRGEFYKHAPDACKAAYRNSWLNMWFPKDHMNLIESSIVDDHKNSDINLNSRINTSRIEIHMNSNKMARTSNESINNGICTNDVMLLQDDDGQDE